MMSSNIELDHTGLTAPQFTTFGCLHSFSPNSPVVTGSQFSPSDPSEVKVPKDVRDMLSSLKIGVENVILMSESDIAKLSDAYESNPLRMFGSC